MKNLVLAILLVVAAAFAIGPMAATLTGCASQSPAAKTVETTVVDAGLTAAQELCVLGADELDLAALSSVCGIEIAKLTAYLNAKIEGLRKHDARMAAAMAKAASRPLDPWRDAYVKDAGADR